MGQQTDDGRYEGGISLFKGEFICEIFSGMAIRNSKDLLDVLLDGYAEHVSRKLLSIVCFSLFGGQFRFKSH